MSPHGISVAKLQVMRCGLMNDTQDHNSIPTKGRAIASGSTLYPNAAAPNHGVFVENRLRHLVDTGDASATVVAPVPYFPSRAPIFGAWARHAAAPRQETRNGINVYHPRYLAIPRVGMNVSPWLLYRSALPILQRLLSDGLQVNAIDAHYLYPDGVAADKMYPKEGPAKTSDARAGRLCLAATKLSIAHPRTGERMTFELPTPEEFRAALGMAAPASPGAPAG